MHEAKFSDDLIRGLTPTSSCICNDARIAINKQKMYMKKYIALYMAPISVIEQSKKSTPEEMQKGMDAWKKWNEEHYEEVVEMGAPLGKTKTVSAESTTDTKNEICGYTIVAADSHEDASAIFSDHPHLTMMQGATIDVLECMEMPEKK